MPPGLLLDESSPSEFNDFRRGGLIPGGLWRVILNESRTAKSTTAQRTPKTDDGSIARVLQKHLSAK